MSPAKKSSKSSSSASKRTSKKTTAKKTSTKKSAAGKASTKKTTAKKASARKATQQAKKATPKKTSAQRTDAKKTTAKKAAAKTSATRAASKPTPRVRATKAQASRPAPSKRSSRATKPAKFDAEQLAEIRRRLVDERTALERQLAELEHESFESTQSDITGEVGIDEDFADAGTATFDRERALSIHNNIVDLIDQMTRAIRRIDDGIYGTCERCGRPIDAARLKALPHALLCMDCKRREERAR